MRMLSSDELRSLPKRKYTLIHVLPKEHYENLHIKGAYNICVYEMSFLPKINTLNIRNDRHIVLYGESDNDIEAKVAAQKLENGGYLNISILEGGLNAATGMPLEGNAQTLDPQQLLKLDDGKYSLVADSMLSWSGANANGKHFGEIRLENGTIEVEDGLLSGSFSIDMRSIKTLDIGKEEGSEYLDAHLNSDDFFLTTLFPNAQYSFTNVKPIEKAYQTDINCILDGELTLRGIHREQKVNCVISKIDKSLILTARVEIDRTKWDIIYGSAKFFKYLGIHQLFDNISIEMRLKLKS